MSEPVATPAAAPAAPVEETKPVETPEATPAAAEPGLPRRVPPEEHASETGDDRGPQRLARPVHFVITAIRGRPGDVLVPDPVTGGAIVGVFDLPEFRDENDREGGGAAVDVCERAGAGQIRAADLGYEATCHW